MALAHARLLLPLFFVPRTTMEEQTFLLLSQIFSLVRVARTFFLGIERLSFGWRKTAFFLPVLEIPPPPPSLSGSHFSPTFSALEEDSSFFSSQARDFFPFSFSFFNVLPHPNRKRGLYFRDALNSTPLFFLFFFFCFFPVSTSLNPAPQRIDEYSFSFGKIASLLSLSSYYKGGKCFLFPVT